MISRIPLSCQTYKLICMVMVDEALVFSCLMLFIDVVTYGGWYLFGDISIMLIGFSWLDPRTARCTTTLG